MTARDLTLSSLYAARDHLGELVVRFTPGEGGGQTEALQQLLDARDQVSGAINGVIGAAFRDVPSPQLLGAAKELAATTGTLRALGQTLAEVSAVVQQVELALSLVSKILALAA